MDSQAEETRSVKPRISAANYEAYRRAAELPYGQRVTLAGVKAIAVGRYEDRLVFRIKNRNTDIYPGDPRLLELELVQ